MGYTLTHYEMEKAYTAYKQCTALLDTAWGKRLWYTVPQLWQAVVLPVRIGRTAGLQAKATADGKPMFDARKASESMAFVAPAVKHGLQRAILDLTDTEQEPLLETLLEIWEPFCAPRQQKSLGATRLTA